MMVNWSSVSFLKGLFNWKSCSVMEKTKVHTSFKNVQKYTLVHYNWISVKGSRSCSSEKRFVYFIVFLL